MKMWRCHLCNTVFEAARPKCATCRLDPEKDPRHVHYLHELVTVHFDPPSHVPGLGRGTLACDATKRVAGSRATAEPSAVSCKLCKLTAEYLAAVGEDPVIIPEQNETVTIDSPCA